MYIYIYIYVHILSISVRGLPGAARVHPVAEARPGLPLGMRPVDLILYYTILHYARQYYIVIINRIITTRYCY